MKNLEGRKAPAFNLEGNDGKEHSLADYKVKTVVLYFYPKDDTPGCTKEACGFRDLNTSLKKADAVVLGVSKDSIETHKKFAGKYKLPFTLLSESQNRSDEKVRRLRQENDVRERSGRHDSLDRGDWAQGRCDQTLAGRKEGRSSPPPGLSLSQGKFLVAIRPVRLDRGTYSSQGR